VAELAVAAEPKYHAVGGHGNKHGELDRKMRGKGLEGAARLIGRCFENDRKML
jgi:hypothetical protein